MITADQVWGLAVAADRVNGGYFKYDVRSADNLFVSKEANKQMVKRWIREQAFSEATEQDVEQGREIRRHFNSYTFLALQGRLNDFQRQALKIAQMDEFNERQSLEFSVISCLPETARRDQRDREFRRALRESTPLDGQEKDRVRGTIRVDRVRYSTEYNSFMITARMDDSWVEFWFNRDLGVDTEHEIQARIRRQKDNGITQLNYARLVVDKAV